jgi:hypothetical protein
MVLATPMATAFPTTPGNPHQTAAPTTIAVPSKNRPIPSRRRTGSTSLTPGPIRRTALPTAWARPARIAAIPSKSWSNSERRWRRLLERLVPDRLRGALAGAATVGEALLLPLDRGLERWDEPDLLRGRGGEDARDAMLGRLQDQWPDGRVTRRAQSGSARCCRNRQRWSVGPMPEPSAKPAAMAPVT